MVEKYEKARQEWQGQPTDPERIIWYGRRTAYIGRYLDAIDIYTEGIRLHPQEPRLYRHRGHRYISVRQLPLAIADLEHAASLIAGTEDVIEPDGLPNAKNIPLSTLHGNIWYHLGLTYYLSGELESAESAYRECLAVSGNDDMVAATVHWLYMTLRRMGRTAEAEQVLAPVDAEMEIIENMAYHRLCLFYKGEIDIATLTGDEHGDVMDAAVAYGLGCWYLYNDSPDEATETFEALLEQQQWAAFGYIAAEAELAGLLDNLLPVVED
jgi:tetratricopeptide (TPR) repeat protein